MPLLFSYGTLQEEAVQRSLFGRALVGQPDVLRGFQPVLVRVGDPNFARTSGKTHHAMLRPTPDDSASVSGMALEVTDDELACADAYEPVEYQRTTVRLASGRHAWVYVDAAFATHRP